MTDPNKPVGEHRNIRTVWTIPTQAYAEAHFATFPERLARTCILAGTSERGACAECGSPWRRKTTGWEPTCDHRDAGVVPCVVLDPFGGAGTTGLVADRLGRDAILVELNDEYAAMARRRIYDDAPLFADVEINKHREGDERI